MSEEHDYSEFTDANIGANSMARLSGLIKDQLDKETEIAALEEALTKSKKELDTIKQGHLPTLMDELGLSEFKTDTGVMVKVKEFIRASIPKDKQNEAFDWLKENDNEALIKNKIEVDFAAKQNEKAQAMLAAIKAHDPAAKVAVKRSVHAQTLGAFVRDRLEKGEATPDELFGVFRQRISEIKVVSD